APSSYERACATHPRWRNGDSRLNSDHRSVQPPPLQVFVQAPAHARTHPPPVQLFVHVEPGRHSNAQLPPPQVFRQAAPLSHTPSQLPPEQPVVQLAAPWQVIEQLPSGQFGLQFALHSHAAFAGNVVMQSLPAAGASRRGGASVAPGASEALAPSALPPASP